MFSVDVARFSNDRTIDLEITLNVDGREDQTFLLDGLDYDDLLRVADGLEKLSYDIDQINDFYFPEALLEREHEVE